MAQSLLELIIKTSKQGQGGKQAAAELKEVKGTVGELSSGLLGMDVASLTAIGAITALGGLVSDSVSKWSDYAEAVGTAADVSGIGAEEMSRLIQAADDMRVSQEDLTKAFGFAQKNGFLPTIANLATLADRVRDMDVLERTTTLTKIFGKSWQTIWPLLKDGGQAIRDNTAAIADNMVVTDDAVAANREWIVAVDNLDDAMTGMKNTLAQGVIPSMTEFVELLTGPSADQAANFINEVFKGSFLESAESKAARVGKALLEVNSSMDVGASNRSEFIDSFNKISEAESGFTSSSMSAASAVRDNLSQALSQQGAIQTQLADATKQLAADQKSFGQSLASDVASQLEQAGLKGQNLKGALGAIDTQMGTNYLTTQNQKEAVKKLVDQYARDKDLNKFSTGLEDINNKFAPLDESVKTSTKNVADLNTQLALAAIAVDALNGSTIWIETKYTSTGTPNPKNPKSTTPWEGASGLDVMVPAGFPNDTAPFMASSGERVIILPKGQTDALPGGPSVLIQQVVLADRMGLEEFKIMLMQVLRK